MVGLSLHLGNKDAARDFEKRTAKAVQEGTREFSLVSHNCYNPIILRGFYLNKNLNLSAVLYFIEMRYHANRNE